MTETKRPLDLAKLPLYHRNAIRRLEQLGAGLSILARYCRDEEPKYSACVQGHARWIMLAAATLDEQSLTATNLSQVLELLERARVALPMRFMLSTEALGFVDQSREDFAQASLAVDELTDALLDARAMRRVEQSQMLEGETAKHVRALASFEADAAGLIVAVMSDGEILIAKDRAGTYPARATFEQLLKRLEHHVVIQDIEKGEPLAAQIERLANWILHNAPEQITEGGAVDVAIKTLDAYEKREARAANAMAWMLKQPWNRLEDLRAFLATNGGTIANAIEAIAGSK